MRRRTTNDVSCTNTLSQKWQTSHDQAIRFYWWSPTDLVVVVLLKARTVTWFFTVHYMV